MHCITCSIYFLATHKYVIFWIKVIFTRFIQDFYNAAAKNTMHTNSSTFIFIIFRNFFYLFLTDFCHIKKDFMLKFVLRMSRDPLSTLAAIFAFRFSIYEANISRLALIWLVFNCQRGWLSFFHATVISKVMCMPVRIKPALFINSLKKFLKWSVMCFTGYLPHKMWRH